MNIAIHYIEYTIATVSGDVGTISKTDLVCFPFLFFLRNSFFLFLFVNFGVRNIGLTTIRLRALGVNGLDLLNGDVASIYVGKMTLRGVALSMRLERRVIILAGIVGCGSAHLFCVCDDIFVDVIVIVDDSSLYYCSPPERSFFL